MPRILWIAPQSELLTQASDTFQRLRAYVHEGIRIQPEEEIGSNDFEGDIPYHVCFLTHVAAKAVEWREDDFQVIVDREFSSW